MASAETLAKNLPQSSLWDIQLSTCSVSDLTKAALKILPHTVHCLLRRAWSSWMCCDVQAHVTLEIFMPQLDALPRRRVISELGPKSLQHSHNPLCSFVLKHETTSSIPVAAIFIQPAPLVTTEETKCARLVQINLELPACSSQCRKSSSFIQVYRFCVKCQEIKNNPVISMRWFNSLGRRKKRAISTS